MYDKTPCLGSSIVFLLLAVLVYGPFLPLLGFYWDDWAFVWLRVHEGTQGLVENFNLTSPIRGWMEGALSPVLGVDPLAWQVIALLTRWLATLTFWWLLYTLWPKRQGQAIFASAMMLVYPGYSQQPLAMTYYFYWVFAAFFFLSFALMVRSLQSGKPVWWMFLISLILSAAQLVSMEYLAGLELLRPLVLLLVFARIVSGKLEIFKQTVLFELPYVLVLGVYTYWRLFLFGASVYSPVLFSRLEFSPWETLVNLLATILDALKQANFTAWLPVFHLPPLNDWGTFLTLIYLTVIFASLIGSLYLFLHSGDDQSLPLDWIIFGFLGMLVAGLPFFIAGLTFRLTFPEDRFTLAYMPLVGIFFAGLVWLIRNSSQRALVAGLIIALAAGYQMQVLKQYSDDWKVQKSFAWQLAWRVPNLTHGTMIVSEDYDTFRYNDDEATAAIVNWMYAPYEPGTVTSNSYVFISARLLQDLPVMLQGDSQNFPPILVTRFSPPGCLHIYHPEYDDGLLSFPNHRDVSALSGFNLPIVPDYTRQTVPLSNPGLTTGGKNFVSVPEFMGPEPARGWCYTYQKADLARQSGNWSEVARLGDEAFAIPMLPTNPYEHLPFIEAYARLGRIKDARLLTYQVTDSMPLLKPALCSLWQRIPDLPAARLDEVRQRLEVCPVKP